MMETIFQLGISNAAIACLLAIVAYSVGVYANRPKLTHLLWVLVLVKLVTPPIFNLPLTFNAAPAESVATKFVSDNDFQEAMVAIVDQVHNESEMDRGNLAASEFVSASFWNTTKPWLGVAWLLGTISVLLISIVRVVRFHLLLKLSAQQTERKLLIVGERLAQQLGLHKMPTITTTTANISPMVWWIGGGVKIVLPQSVMDKMSDEQCQLILAHEMAHICRRDYLVRWLEWLARVAFWWNPIVWWAQRNLRAVEEACCDELVLSKLNPSAKSYANTILTTVESLVSPVIRPPAMVSEINSGGFLERRIEKILTRDLIQQPTRRRSVLAMYFALFVIPFGFVNARDTAQEHQQVEAAAQEITKHDHDQNARQKALEIAQALREYAETLKAAKRSGSEATMHDQDQNVQQKALAELAQTISKTAETAKMSDLEALASFYEAAGKKDNKLERRVVDPEARKRVDAAEKKLQQLIDKRSLVKVKGELTEKEKAKEGRELMQTVSQFHAALNNLVEAGELTEHEVKMKLHAYYREWRLAR